MAIKNCNVSNKLIDQWNRIKSRISPIPIWLFHFGQRYQSDSVKKGKSSINYAGKLNICMETKEL